MPNYHEKILNKIIGLTKKNPAINALWVYGSVVDGTLHKHSDIDLAVQFTSFIPDIEERVLRPQLLKIDLCSALSVSDELISIVDLNQASIPLAWEILSTGKLLFSKDANLRIRFECSIFSRYELDIVYHRKLYG